MEAQDQKVFVFVNRTSIEGVAPGQPALFWMPSMRVSETPTLFIDEQYVRSGGTPSTNTWKAVAYALASWLEFLVAVEIVDWRDASLDDLESYRDAFLGSVSPRTHQCFSSSTVRQRMTFVINFYRYASARGLYCGTIVSDPEVRERTRISLDRDALAHIRSGSRTYATKTSSAVRLLPRERQRNERLRPLTREAYLRLCEQLGPLPSEIDSRTKQYRRSRDRLIIDTAFWTGMRVEEVASLTRYQFDTLFPNPKAPGAYQKISITGKGRKQRTIRIPNWLVLEVQAYINDERRVLFESKGLRDHASLFVVERGHRSAGNALSKRTMQEVMQKNCVAAGLTKAGDLRSAARHSFHDLRHSYAVWTYWVERELGNAEPWKLIASQLGHTSMTTTIDTYLHYVELFGEFEKNVDVRGLVGV